MNNAEKQLETLSQQALKYRIKMNSIAQQCEEVIEFDEIQNSVRKETDILQGQLKEMKDKIIKNVELLKLKQE
jgi:hypothetical protein